MVRLKAAAGAYFDAQVKHFNSSMVRLKEGCGRFPHNPKSYFNSSMVRLKVFAGFNGGLCIKFQFLYGAIKSAKLAQMAANTIKFQFLYGAIKRGASGASGADITISIPL